MKLKDIKQLINNGKLYFDFSKDAEENKREYENDGYEWKDEYSYNKVKSIVSKYDHDYLCTKLWERKYHNAYILEDIDGEVDWVPFRLKDIKQIDETHFEVKTIDNGVIYLAIRD